jgi:hypothetical protein
LVRLFIFCLLINVCTATADQADRITALSIAHAHLARTPQISFHGLGNRLCAVAHFGPTHFRFESPPLGSLLGVEGPQPGKPLLGYLSLDLLGERLVICPSGAG